MNNWANHQNQDWNPVPPGLPNIEIRSDSSVWRNGWKIAYLVKTESADSEDFAEVQAQLEEQYKVRHPSPVPRPAAVPDVPDDSIVSLLPEDPDLPDDPDLWPDDDSSIAKDFSIPDTTKSRIERCEYLNRLLSRKLDLDFDLAWKEFNHRRIFESRYPKSTHYEDSVYDALQRACTKFYNYFSIEEEYYIVNEHEPIELNISIDWAATIFDDLGYDWWFDISNHTSYLY